MDAETSGRGVALRMRKRPPGEVVVFSKLIVALGLMKGAPMVPFHAELIEDRTAHIPLQVIVRAVQKLVDAGGFRPDIEGILQACEAARLEIRDEVAFKKCENCDPRGMTTYKDDKGVEWAKKCDCWRAHQAKLAQLQAGDQRLALPPAITGDFTQVGDEVA